MNMHLSQRSGNASLMVMIFLGIITLIFGLSAYFQHQHTEEVRTGSTEEGATVRPGDSLLRLTDEIKDEHRKITELHEKIDGLKASTHYYELRIAALGEYYRPGYTIKKEDGEEEVVKAQFIGLSDETIGIHTHHGQANKLIEHQHGILKMWSEHFGSKERQDTPALKKAASDFLDATNDIIAKGGESEANIQNTIDRLNEELDKLKKRRNDLEEDERLQTAIKQTRRGKLNAQIRRLLELELRWLKHLESDGQILQTGISYNFIIVNIGDKEDVKPGMRFEIFSWEKGHYLRKGMCEVIKVDRTISTCRVIHEDNQKENPIAIGDHIGNPVFSAGDPKTFVLAGEFSQFNKEDLEVFIERSGGKVSKIVRIPKPDSDGEYDLTFEPGVDFLVAGARSDSMQDKAREFDMLAMDEETLVKYLNTTFSTDQNREKE